MGYVRECGIVFLDINMECMDDIIYIETSKHKNVFYTVRETYSIYKKMDELEEDLKGWALCVYTKASSST